MNTLSKPSVPHPSPAAPTPVLRIDKLEKSFESFSLHDVSFAVEEGTIVGIVGSNGAGKTTTIKSALGIIFPDGGSIALFGEEVVGMPEKRLAQLKQDVGVVFDSCSFPDEYRVKNVAQAMRRVYANWSDTAFQNLAREFHLPSKGLVKDLSRGMGMKLSLACALAHSPRLLVLDEATAGLDPIARDEVLDMLREFVAEDETRAVLMSSHITSDLDKVADRIVCIDAGSMAFDVDADAISQAGIALCRKADADTVLGSDAFGQNRLRIERDAHVTRILVPDRFAFAEAFPAVPVEAADVESFMHFMLKGAVQ